MLRRSFVALAVSVIAITAPLAAQTSASDERTREDIHRAVLRLPYYGVFDFLSFEYEKGTVTLSGFVFQPSLKRDVLNAVKRVPRVEEVVDRIEELPVSQNDDRIRWMTFRRIYGDSGLSRYAPGGGLSAVDRRFNPLRYPGSQPYGDYPIRIIVKGGRTTLVGVVDSDSDKTIAGMRAREVPGTFGVENELVITDSAGRR
jgi:hyperosmotically inducible periplasmic protein